MLPTDYRGVLYNNFNSLVGIRNDIITLTVLTNNVFGMVMRVYMTIT